MKLLTLADGFGDSVAVPVWYPDFLKWPEILHLMTKKLELVNLSRYGAGNEYLSQCLKANIVDKHVAIIQWALPDRLDLVLSHSTDFWHDQIAHDPIYNNNLICIKNDQYWISSATKNPHVIDYHQKYISLRQHQLRSQLYIEYAKLLLEKHDIDYKFLLSYDSDYLKESVTDYNKTWCWHEPFKGMHSFRKVSKFASLDFRLSQPISLIQYDFIVQFILPYFDLPWRNNRDIVAVENMLYRKYNDALKNKPNDTN